MWRAGAERILFRLLGHAQLGRGRPIGPGDREKGHLQTDAWLNQQAHLPWRCFTGEAMCRRETPPGHQLEAGLAPMPMPTLTRVSQRQACGRLDCPPVSICLSVQKPGRPWGRVLGCISLTGRVSSPKVDEGVFCLLSGH